MTRPIEGFDIIVQSFAWRGCCNMSSNETRALVSAVVEVYNAKDLEGLRDLYHCDATYWSALTDLCEGRDAILAHFQELFSALPDERMSAKVVIAEGETAVAEFESSGCDADGVEYRIEFTEVFKLTDGLIRSVSVYIDPKDVEVIAGTH
tara:strand:+ start:103 stop:552 length:450 start_codon:yes stop_codon:yes gene_type:complete